MMPGTQSYSLIQNAQEALVARQEAQSRKVRAVQVWFAIVSSALIVGLALTGCGKVGNKNSNLDASSPGATCTEFNSPDGFKGCACPVGQQPIVDPSSNVLRCGAPQAGWVAPQGCGFAGQVAYGYVYGQGYACFPYNNGRCDFTSYNGYNNWNQGAYCQVGYGNTCGFNMYCRALNNGSMLGVCSY